MLLLGIGFISVGVLLMGESVSEYDDWVRDPARRPGDSIRVTGKIDERETISVIDLRIYRFEGSDIPFYSGEDIGHEGDTVTLEITISDEGLPVASSGLSLEMCWVPGILCIVIGIILLIMGLIVRGKEPKLYGPGYPPYYPPPYPPQQPYQQYPPPQQPGYQPPPHQYYHDESYNRRNKEDRR